MNSDGTLCCNAAVTQHERQYSCKQMGIVKDLLLNSVSVMPADPLRDAVAKISSTLDALRLLGQKDDQQ